MLARLKAKGLRICVWINPYIAQRSALFEEGRAKGYLVHPAGRQRLAVGPVAGRHGAGRLHQPRRGAVVLGASCERLLDQGVDAFKTDFGERIPTDVVWHDGSDPRADAQLLHPAVQPDRLRPAASGGAASGEAVLFARSATAGGQQFPVHWGGDCDSTFASMAETLRGGLSLAASGFGYWSHDIGGFEGTPDAGGVQALAGVRAAVQPQPAARVRLLPGAVGVRRGGGRRRRGGSPG